MTEQSKRSGLVEAQKPETQKKGYTSPQLFVYGDVREVTRTSPRGGNVADNAQNGNKTA